MEDTEKKEDGRKKNGGYRSNAGRKKGEDTETISFRVKLRLKDRSKKACKEVINKIENEN